MIKTIDIFGLFNSFDYRIELPEKGNQLILTGPNGYGKSTILSIIDALCSLDLLYFYTIPFKFIRVDYEVMELNIISIKDDNRASSDDEIKIQSTLNFVIVDCKSKRQLAILTINKDRVVEAQNKYFREKNLHNIFTTDYAVLFQQDNSQDKKGSRSIEFSDSAERKEILNLIAESQVALGPFMIYMRSLSSPSKFIPAQRLIINNNKNSQFEISRVANDVKEYLNHWFIEFLKNSQEHDSKFITRLLNDQGTIDAYTYSTRIESIKSEINDAIRYDLSTDVDIPPYSSHKAGILKCYLDDLEDKLAIYRTPLKELILFDTLINRKQLVNKTICFNRDNGMRAISSVDNTGIPLEVLSSGEKNQIIMLHDFIFNLKDGTILLIDEPEISLHVAWQHEFMADISKIAKTKSLHVIIATHSPQIIGERWDECSDLFEQAQSSDIFS